MRAIVVVPALNEEALIGDCLRALARQTVPAAEVVLVLNGCTDDTAAVAARAASGLALTLVEGPGGGPGPARRIGMDLAASRLGPSDVIACTDADTVVARDWVAETLRVVASGADAVGGLVELETSGLEDRVVSARDARAVERLRLVRLSSPAAEHHHFAGASMALTVEAYRAVGGMPDVSVLEDVALERALVAAGLRIDRPAAVRVRTSGRLVGRAVGAGLAHDLAAFAAAGQSSSSISGDTIKMS